MNKGDKAQSGPRSRAHVVRAVVGGIAVAYCGRILREGAVPGGVEDCQTCARLAPPCEGATPFVWVPVTPGVAELRVLPPGLDAEEVTVTAWEFPSLWALSSGREAPGGRYDAEAWLLNHGYRPADGS